MKRVILLSLLVCSAAAAAEPSQNTRPLHDKEGHVIGSETDRNGDGKYDVFKHFLKGRNLVLKESDTNFDGKIDKRELLEWSADKKISVPVNGRMQFIPNPGYVALRTEQDTDFDGKIDVYKERGNKSPSKDRIGKPI
ncbi:MAG: hypothetical protein HYZ52_07130 [Candidatus Omnitrophica bacterium]|nr:hypothetical protein [Candidatus Omnitrophota bacterium]